MWPGRGHSFALMSPRLKISALKPMQWWCYSMEKWNLNQHLNVETFNSASYEETPRIHLSTNIKWTPSDDVFLDVQRWVKAPAGVFDRFEFNYYCSWPFRNAQTEPQILPPLVSMVSTSSPSLAVTEMSKSADRHFRGAANMSVLIVQGEKRQPQRVQAVITKH